MSSVLYNITYKLVNGNRRLVGFQTLEMTRELNRQRIIAETLDPNGNITYSMFLDESEHRDVIKQIQEMLDQQIDVRT